MGKAISGWQLNIHFWEININVIFLQLWYSENKGIMTNGGHINDEFLIIVTDSIVNMDVFSNISGENISSIDNFDSFWGF
jgi:hypothetical protein